MLLRAHSQAASVIAYTMPISKKKIVCFGGGTGLSTLLSGLRGNKNMDITAVVTMFDNGRSSGELRDRFGVLPPGDIMKCMVALAQYPEVVREMLNKRVVRSGHAPHSAGNMLLMGIEKVYGDYNQAIEIFSELLSIQGRVLPVTTTPSTLCAEIANGEIIEGQIAIVAILQKRHMVKRIFLKPNVSASPAVIKAINTADVLVVGPGSFYESVLPNFLPAGVAAAVSRSHAPILYITNLLTEGVGMSKDVPLATWIAEAESYVGRPFSNIIVNKSKPDRAVRAAYEKEGKYPLLWDASLRSDPRYVPEDLWKKTRIARHDPIQLTKTLVRLIKKLAR